MDEPLALTIRARIGGGAHVLDSRKDRRPVTDPVAVIVTTSREVIQCVSLPFGYREGPRPLARER